MNYEIDKLDLDIIKLLSKSATTPYTSIAKKLGVSSGTIHVRMSKMEDMGVIKGSRILVDTSKLGYDICAFIGVYLDKGSFYLDVVKKMEKVQEVVELHYTTGVYSMFVKIICRDTQHLRSVLNDKIQTIEGIQRTETFISLEESIKRNLMFS